MACKYKYKNNWYSEEQVKKLIESEIKKDDIVLELLKNYSHTIEINTAKDKIKDAFGNVWVDAYPNKKIGDYVTIDNKEWKILGTRFEDDSWGESGLDERESFIVGNDGEPTQHYSNLTVPGGTNGSYIEANIETPMIIPSIQSHAEFKTENTIGWMRADEKQNYQEKDIDNLIEIMKKSGILGVNCG